jgi:hypothetical protein
LLIGGLPIKFFNPVIITNIFKDARTYVSNCDECQRMGKPIARDQIPLQDQVVIEPFEKCTLDFVGPINLATKKKKVYTCMY